jgi:hypothetical protein
MGPASKDWALGKKHIFLSESLRQHLERIRSEKRNQSATRIQVMVLLLLLLLEINLQVLNLGPEMICTVQKLYRKN